MYKGRMTNIVHAFACSGNSTAQLLGRFGVVNRIRHSSIMSQLFACTCCLDNGGRGFHFLAQPRILNTISHGIYVYIRYTYIYIYILGVYICVQSKMAGQIAHGICDC